MVATKIDDMFAKFDKPKDIPVQNDDDVLPQDLPQDPPIDDVNPQPSLQDLLLDPEPELWNGLVQDGFLYFVDDVGFGWKVLLSTDEFFLTGMVYDISTFLGSPRSQRMSFVLGRIHFQGTSSPLYGLSSVGEGIVTIHRSPHSEKIVKILMLHMTLLELFIFHLCLPFILRINSYTGCMSKSNLTYWGRE